MPRLMPTSMTPLRIIFSGSGEFGAPSLRALLEAGHDIVQVVSQPDRPAGRGRKLTPTPISTLAIEKNLPLLRTGDINAEPLPAADLMVVIAFGQKIAGPIIHHPRLGSFNLHASRLPKYRGAAPINWAVINGESVTGNSIIRLADRMDAGAILAQSSLPIGDTDTAGEIHDRLSVDGASLVVSTARSLAEGGLLETPQDESQATLAPKLSRESSRVDWSQPADALSRRIRGMSPWPGCRMRLLDTAGHETARLTLVRTRAGGESTAQAGTIDESLAVACGDHLRLDVLEVQPEGRRPMPLDDFRRGHRWEAGMTLESLA